MAERKEPSGARKVYGNFAPAFVHFTDDVLGGEGNRTDADTARSRFLD